MLMACFEENHKKQLKVIHCYICFRGAVGGIAMTSASTPFMKTSEEINAQPSMLEILIFSRTMGTLTRVCVCIKSIKIYLNLIFSDQNQYRNCFSFCFGHLKV